MILPTDSASTPPSVLDLHPPGMVMLPPEVIHLLGCLHRDDLVALIGQIGRASHTSGGPPVVVRPEGWACPCGRVTA